MLGVTFGVIAGTRHAQRLGLDAVQVRRMTLACGIGCVLGAHYVDLFLYQPGWTEQPDAVWRFVNPSAGISSYGGILGGAVGFLWSARRLGGKRLRYADAAAIGALVLMTFGRAGCASVHDHIGTATEFALAVDFPRGNPTGVVGPHHDLGLYEFALLLVLLPLAVHVLRTPRRHGWFVGVLAIGYAAPRFFLDFLRRASSDPRYLALTPAQWACVGTFAIGLLLVIRTWRAAPPEAYLPATPWRVHLRDLVRLT